MAAGVGGVGAAEQNFGGFRVVARLLAGGGFEQGAELEIMSLAVSQGREERQRVVDQGLGFIADRKFEDGVCVVWMGEDVALQGVEGACGIALRIESGDDGLPRGCGFTHARWVLFGFGIARDGD